MIEINEFIRLNSIRFVLSSHLFSTVIGCEHKDVMRDIRNIIGHLGKAKIGDTPYFTESTYKTSNNLDSYLLKNSRRYESNGLYTI